MIIFLIIFTIIIGYLVGRYIGKFKIIFLERQEKIRKQIEKEEAAFYTRQRAQAIKEKIRKLRRR